MVGQPGMMIPGMPMQPQPKMMAQPGTPQPTQWQNQQPKSPSLAIQAAGIKDPAPTTVRGVSGPSTQPTTAKFVLPSPHALGVSTEVKAAPSAPAQTAVDWNQVQARVEKLGVLRYQKDRLENGAVRVTILLPTADPTRGQPVEAQAATEAAAIVMALDHAEEWARKR